MVELKEPPDRERIYVQAPSETPGTAAAVIISTLLLFALVMFLFFNFDSIRSWTQAPLAPPYINQEIESVPPGNTIVPTPIPVPVPVPDRSPAPWSPGLKESQPESLPPDSTVDRPGSLKIPADIELER